MVITTAFRHVTQIYALLGRFLVSFPSPRICDALHLLSLAETGSKSRLQPFEHLRLFLCFSSMSPESFDFTTCRKWQAASSSPVLYKGDVVLLKNAKLSGGGAQPTYSHKPAQDAAIQINLVPSSVVPKQVRLGWIPSFCLPVHSLIASPFYPCGRSVTYWHILYMLFISDILYKASRILFSLPESGNGLSGPKKQKLDLHQLVFFSQQDCLTKEQDETDGQQGRLSSVP